MHTLNIHLFARWWAKHKRSSTSSSSSHIVSSSDTSVENKMPSANIGIILMILYVCFDAFTSNWQSKLFKSISIENAIDD